MNKLLLGTTALVAASLLMAGSADAGKPKVKWGGSLQFQVGGSDQDIEKQAFGGGAGLSSSGPSLGYAFRTNSELKFNASGKTDAGMKWKAEVQLEADTNVAANDDGVDTNISAGEDGNLPQQETVIDETWIRFSGSWGRLTVGNQDGVEVDYLVSSDSATGKAGSGGVDGSWDDFIDARPANGRLWDEVDDNEDTSDATKVIYYTPRVGGFGAGISFTPDSGAHGQATGTDDTDDFTNSIAFGADFKKKLGDFKVEIAAAGHFADAVDETTEDLEAWSVGAVVGFGGWKLGGNYMNKGDSFEDKGDDDVDAWAWTAGLGYSQGPIHLGVSYLHSEVEDGPDDEHESDTLIVGATYVLGGGARVYADLFWLDQDDAGGTSSNEGVGFLLGVGVKF